MKKSQLKTLIKEALLEGGYSNYYPGGKTPGLSSDVLNKILLRIAQGKRTEDEPYEGDPERGNKILDTADQENVDRILRGEEPEVDRMQELAGLKKEIKIQNPSRISKYKEACIKEFEKLKEEDGEENEEFYNQLILDIQKSSTEKEINDIIFKDFYFSDDVEGMEDFKQDIENAISSK